MGGRKADNPQPKIYIEDDNLSTRARRGRHINDRRSASRSNPQQIIGNQSIIGNLDIIDERDPFNDAMVVEEDDVDNFLSQIKDSSESEMSEDDKSEDSIVMDKDEEDERKSDVAQMGDIIKEGEEELDEKISKLSEDGLNSQANDARQVKNEIQQINQGMQQVREWNFATIPKKRQTASGWRKFWTRATTFFGAVTKAIVNIISAPVAWYFHSSSKKRLRNATAAMQQAKDIETIPGWGGAKYSRKENETADDFLGDARRVPAVWSYLTGDEATYKEGEETKARDPEVLIMIHQPKAGSVEHLESGKMGHAMLGINYTRYSKITGRYERYGLKYGFYPAGGMIKNGTVAMALRGTILPGQLMDDKEHAVSVSRRYPATMEQVGTILKESERYAEGGYGYYSRNCTTFVRDMTVKFAKIAPEGDSIFKEAEVGFSARDNIGKWLGYGAETYLTAGLRNDLARYSTNEDQTYQNYGNKRVTANDMQSFDRTDKGLADRMALIPSETGENLRFESGNNGQISSYEYTGKEGEDITQLEDKLNVVMLAERINTEAKSLRRNIFDAVTHELLISGPEDLQSFVYGLKNGGEAYQGLNKLKSTLIARLIKDGKDIEVDKKLHEVVDEDHIKEARRAVAKTLNELATIYDKYLGRDKRLENPIMNMISLCQLAVVYLDNEYAKYVENKNLNNKEDDLPESAYKRLNKETKTEYKDSNNEEFNYKNMTPSRFEAFMQMNGFDADKAMEQYHEGTRLYIREGNKEKLTSAEKKKLETFKRVLSAADSFMNSHRYILEKDILDKQDVMYIIKLIKGEEAARRVSSDIVASDVSAGTIYREVMIGNIFGGIKKAFFEDASTGSLAEHLETINNGEDKNGEIRKKWLKDYVEKCIKKNEEGFRNFAEVMYDMNNHNEDVTLDAVAQYIFLYIIAVRRTITDDETPLNQGFLQTTEFFHDAFTIDMADTIKSFFHK
ncbi:hypothetical protein [Butyrivibrio sp. AE3004]|uniref:hypothetical protein n=1 Tax=Butyrivibrio sp. AE3004 TaxID=1506994 RepID=UPI00049493CD|nr:hypothetical protein [Butyrivibrio sp. AE3004]